MALGLDLLDSDPLAGDDESLRSRIGRRVLGDPSKAPTRIVYAVIFALILVIVVGTWAVIQSETSSSGSSYWFVQAVASIVSTMWVLVPVAIYLFWRYIGLLRKRYARQAADVTGWLPESIERLSDEMRSTDGTMRVIATTDHSFEEITQHVDAALRGDPHPAQQVDFFGRGRDDGSGGLPVPVASDARPVPPEDVAGENADRDRVAELWDREAELAQEFNVLTAQLDDALDRKLYANLKGDPPEDDAVTLDEFLTSEVTPPTAEAAAIVDELRALDEEWKAVQAELDSLLADEAPADAAASAGGVDESATEEPADGGDATAPADESSDGDGSDDDVIVVEPADEEPADGDVEARDDDRGGDVGDATSGEERDIIEMAFGADPPADDEDEEASFDEVFDVFDTDDSTGAAPVEGDDDADRVEGSTAEEEPDAREDASLESDGDLQSDETPPTTTGTPTEGDRNAAEGRDRDTDEPANVYSLPVPLSDDEEPEDCERPTLGDVWRSTNGVLATIRGLARHVWRRSVDLGLTVLAVVAAVLAAGYARAADVLAPVRDRAPAAATAGLARARDALPLGGDGDGDDDRGPDAGRMDREEPEIPWKVRFAEELKHLLLDLTAGVHADEFIWKFGLPAVTTFISLLLVARLWVHPLLYVVFGAVAIMVGLGSFWFSKKRRSRRLRLHREPEGYSYWDDAAGRVKTVETADVTCYMGWLAGRRYASYDRAEFVREFSLRLYQRTHDERVAPSVLEQYARNIAQMKPNLHGHLEHIERPQIQQEIKHAVESSRDQIIDKAGLAMDVIEHPESDSVVSADLGHDPRLVAEEYRWLVEDGHVLAEVDVEFEDASGRPTTKTLVYPADKTRLPDMEALHSQFSDRFTGSHGEPYYQLPDCRATDDLDGFVPSPEIAQRFRTGTGTGTGDGQPAGGD